MSTRDEYRRRRDSDVWHFHLRCRWFPKLGLKTLQRYEKPASGEFCNECLAKERKDQKFSKLRGAGYGKE